MSKNAKLLELSLNVCGLEVLASPNLKVSPNIEQHHAYIKHETTLEVLHLVRTKYGEDIV
jgi:hypothetical protein